MKRLPLYIFLVLMWCNVGFAECIEGDCNNGYGTFTWESGEFAGDKYVGKWRDGNRHGQGTYTWANGNKYVGKWRDDKINGQGTFTYANGEKYVGEWKENKKHGQGTYTWTNGDKYVGEHKDDKRNGQGTFTWADGRVDKGIWEKDRLIEPSLSEDSKKDFEISIAEQEKLAGLPSEFVYLPSDVDKSKLDYIIFGMSPQDVLRIQGKPSRVFSNRYTEIDLNNADIYDGYFQGYFLYGESRVTFGLVYGVGVESWKTVDQKIKAKIWLKKEMTTKKVFTFGDDVYDVLFIQGKPDGVANSSTGITGVADAGVYAIHFSADFLYGKSKVVFSMGKVESWETVDQKIKAKNSYLD